MAQDKDVKIIAEKICVSTTGLCEILGVDKSTLTRWEEKDCPKVQRGWWSLKDVLDWRNASFDKDKSPDDMSFIEKKIYYEGKLKEAQLETVELKNKISRGEYIAKDEIVRELSRCFTILKRSMLGFGNKIAAELAHLVDTQDARRIAKLVQDVTADALEQMSIDGVYEARKKAKKEISTP